MSPLEWVQVADNAWEMRAMGARAKVRRERSGRSYYYQVDVINSTANTPVILYRTLEEAQEAARQLVIANTRRLIGWVEPQIQMEKD